MIFLFTQLRALAHPPDPLGNPHTSSVNRTRTPPFNGGQYIGCVASQKHSALGLQPGGRKLGAECPQPLAIFVILAIKAPPEAPAVFEFHCRLITTEYLCAQRADVGASAISSKLARAVELADREFAPRQGAPFVAIERRDQLQEIGKDICW